MTFSQNGPKVKGRLQLATGMPRGLLLCVFCRQESVEMGMYSPLEVTVETEEGELSCRTYKMNECVVTATSPQYKQVKVFPSNYS